jgi:VanZ family protein
VKSPAQGGSPTGRRLGQFLIGYLLVVVGGIVLAPFELALPDRLDWNMLGPAGWTADDLLLNVVLFVPLGFLVERQGGGRWTPGRVVLAGLCLSLMIEVTQLFIPGRWSSVSDLVANTTGAWLGALGSGALRRRIGDASRLAGRLFLEVPLVGFLWLLVPMLWVASLAAGEKLTVIPAAAAAGVALAAAGVSSTAPEQRGGFGLIPVMLGWSGIALMPLAIVRWPAAAFAAAAGLAALLIGEHRFRAWRRRDRRVEPRAVALVLVLLLPHLVATTMPGLVPGLGSDTLLARQGILGWLAGVAAFTVLGYLMAEWRGRRASRWPDTAIWPMVVAALVTPLADAGHGVAGRLVPAIVAAGMGALLFELQREHVVALRRRATRTERGLNVTNLASDR